MLTTFSIFRILNVFYQVISTFFVYGIHLCESSHPALIREGIWLLFLFVVLILGSKKFKPYWKHWKKTWIAFIILILISVFFSWIKDVSRSNMFIGIKYGFRWMFILLSAGFFGYVISEKWQKSKLIQILPRVLVGIVGAGFLWQGAKLLRPDFFYSLGYGGLNDYTQGENPPIYYLTGYQGTLRWQGFFSGPNNYGYFLVAFLPFVWRFFTNKIKKKEDTVLSVLALVVRMAGMVVTLSRAVLVGIVVAFVFLYWKIIKEKKNLLGYGALVGIAIFPFALLLLSFFKGGYLLLFFGTSRILLSLIISTFITVFVIKSWAKITKYKKWGYGMGIGVLIGIVLVLILWLSVLKRKSTIGHITSKIETVPEVISQPLGHGLGSSGPAIHYEGKYLPENYFLQIMLDIGTVGFLFRTFVILCLLLIQYKVIGIRKGKLTNEEEYQLQVLYKLQIGFFALFIMGLFLHVFEDSMVNYLFFTIYGIVLGSLSIKLKKDLTWKEVLEQNKDLH